MGSIDEGARNAVAVCMGLKAGERVLIVTDKPQKEVGDALRRAAEGIISPSNVKYFVLEDVAKRPLSGLPKVIEESIPWSNVTFWAAESQPGELGARHAFINAAKTYARHGHMPNITKALMEQGMCSDYNEVYALTHKVYDVVSKASRIRVTNKLGVDLSVDFDRTWRWVPSDGRYQEKGRWGNLPEGEVFTAPKTVNGHLVTNLLGDWFSEKYGNFEDSLSFDVKDSQVESKTIKCKNSELKEEITKYLSTDKYSNRASEFALPTNPLLISLPTIGNLLQDEKARVHVAFGDPYRDETRAPWESTTHVDMLLEECDVTVDEKRLMQRGKYVI